MKIAIKISVSQFNVLHQLFENYNAQDTKYLGRETRVRRYVLEKVIIRLKKQYIDTQQSQDLFNQKKKIKLSFEYYEAHYLELVLSKFPNTTDPYVQNTIRMITAELNAKLA